jgi:hypothetical protein
LGLIPARQHGTYSPPGAPERYLGSVTGNPVISIGDVNGDGLQDFQATLVSSSSANAGWESDPFIMYEIWKVKIVSAP